MSNAAASHSSRPLLRPRVTDGMFEASKFRVSKTEPIPTSEELIRMSWPQIAVVVLEIIGVIVTFAGGAAGIAVFVQIVRHGGCRPDLQKSIAEGR